MQTHSILDFLFFNSFFINTKKTCSCAKYIFYIVQSLWEKMGVLQLALQFNFSIAMSTCNSLYFYVMSVIKQATWIVRIVTHRIYYAIHYNSIATQLQLYWNNSFSTTMQFYYNYGHNVMMMLLIFIHPLKCETWHYKKFWI